MENQKILKLGRFKMGKKKIAGLLAVYVPFVALLTYGYLERDSLVNEPSQVCVEQKAQADLTQLIELSQLESHSERLANLERKLLDPEDLVWWGE